MCLCVCVCVCVCVPDFVLDFYLALVVHWHERIVAKPGEHGDLCQPHFCQPKTATTVQESDLFIQ